MIGHLIPLPGLAVNSHAGHPPQFALKGIQQRQLQRRRAAEKRFRVVWRRDKIAAHRLRQRFNQGDNQLPSQTGDLPLKPGLFHLVEQRQRNMHRHAVGICARLELIGQTQFQIALVPEVRIVQLTDLLRAFFNQHTFFKVKQIRRLATGLLPPFIEVARGDDVMADALVVELKQRFVVDKNVAAARLMLQLFNLVAQLQVVTEEGVAGLPVALHQRMADKQFAAQRRVNLAVVDLTGRDDRQTVNGDLLRRHHRALRALPVRFAVRTFEQVLSDRLDPFRLYACGDTPPQAAGFHQLGDHRPFRRLFKQPGAGEDRKASVARAGVFLLIGIFHTDVRQQTGQQRGVNFAILCRFAIHRQAELFNDLTQLSVDILPLAHAQVVEKIDPALAAELVRGERFLLLAQVVPQVDERHEVGLFIVEAAMLLIGSLLLIHWPLARVLNRERRGDNHRLAHAAVFLRLQHHSCQTRIHRQLAELAPHRRQLIGGLLFVSGNRPQLFQQTHAVLNIAFIRRFNERESGNIAESERGHLQDNRRQVGAQNLRIGKFRARQEVLF